MLQELLSPGKYLPAIGDNGAQTQALYNVDHADDSTIKKVLYWFWWFIFVVFAGAELIAICVASWTVYSYEGVCPHLNADGSCRNFYCNPGSLYVTTESHVEGAEACPYYRSTNIVWAPVIFWLCAQIIRFPHIKHTAEDYVMVKCQNKLGLRRYFWLWSLQLVTLGMTDYALKTYLKEFANFGWAVFAIPFACGVVTSIYVYLYVKHRLTKGNDSTLTWWEKLLYLSASCFGGFITLLAVWIGLTHNFQRFLLGYDDNWGTIIADLTSFLEIMYTIMYAYFYICCCCCCCGLLRRRQRKQGAAAASKGAIDEEAGGVDTSTDTTSRAPVMAYPVTPVVAYPVDNSNSNSNNRNGPPCS